MRSNSFYGKVARPTVLSNVSCSGNEHTLQSCLHSTSGNCPMNENAGVQCPTVPVRCKLYYDNPLFNTCTCNSYGTSLVPLVYLLSCFSPVIGVDIVHFPIVVDGDQNVELSCLGELNRALGPDYSALNMEWRYNNRTVVSNCSKLQPSGNTEITHLLYCNLTLASISAASAGTYTCSGAIIGRNATSFYSIALQVQGLEFLNASTHMN